jgi:hypothetical protein
VEQVFFDAPVAIDGPKARRDHRRECRRLQLLDACERACWVWSTQGLMETVENGGRHFPLVRICTYDLRQPKFLRPLKILINVIRTPVVLALLRLNASAMRPSMGGVFGD